MRCSPQPKRRPRAASAAASKSRPVISSSTYSSPAIRADTRWNAFENQSGAVFLRRHGGFPGLGLPGVANDGFHNFFLLLKSGIRHTRHVRPEVNMHVDRSMHDVVNHCAKIILGEHGRGARGRASQSLQYLFLESGNAGQCGVSVPTPSLPKRDRLLFAGIRPL